MFYLLQDGCNYVSCLGHGISAYLPEGPSTKYLRFLAPKTIHSTVFGAPEASNIGYLDPLELRGLAAVCAPGIVGGF